MVTCLYRQPVLWLSNRILPKDRLRRWGQPQSAQKPYKMKSSKQYQQQACNNRLACQTLTCSTTRHQVTVSHSKACHNWLAHLTPTHITQCQVTITCNPPLCSRLLIILISCLSGSLHCSNLVYKITSPAHIISIQAGIVPPILPIWDQHHNNLSLLDSVSIWSHLFQM